MNICTHNKCDFQNKNATPTRTFAAFNEATRAGYRTKDSWTLEDRKVVGPASAAVLLGSDLCPVWHNNQTRPCNVRPRTKAYIHFRRLFGFESKKYIVAHDGKWSHHHDWFSSSRIAQHLNGSKIFGGFAAEEQKAVILDVDFHEPLSAIQPCLNALQTVLNEVPVLMTRLGGYGLHFQVKESDVDGLHLIFFLRPTMPAEQVETQFKNWRIETEIKHADVLDARKNVALIHDKRNIHLVDKSLTRTTGIRLPLCRGRLMLLDEPLPNLANGKPDVESYIEWAIDPVTMKTADVMSFVESRFKQEIQCKTFFEEQNGTESDFSDENRTGIYFEEQNKTRLCQHDHKLKWKGNTRRIFAGCFLGKGDLPGGTLNEISGVLARFAPDFCANVDEAVDAYQRLIKDIPKSGWYMSSRLESQELSKLVGVFRRQVKSVFAGTLSQSESGLSERKIKAIARRWREIGYSPFLSKTWSNGWTTQKLEITWSADDILEFEQKIRPLLGRAGRELDLVKMVDDVVVLVMQKEKQENGISLRYWRMYFEDRWSLECGKTEAGSIRHQNIVEMLRKLGVVVVIQGALFKKSGKGQGVARRFAPGWRVNEKQGWSCSEKTIEERIAEAIGYV
jgi:hypothetical protein